MSGNTRQQYGYMRQDGQSKVDSHIRMEKKLAEKVPRFDPKLIDQGFQWYKSGFSLDDAPENLKNNINFYNGYMRGVRLQDVNDEFFSLGMETYLLGKSWENIPTEHKENIYFMQGYEEAMFLQTKKHR